MSNIVFIQSELFNTFLGFIGIGICIYVVYNLFHSENKTVAAICLQALVCVANLIPSLYSLGRAAGLVGDKVTELFMRAIFPTNNLLWIIVGLVIVHYVNDKHHKATDNDTDKVIEP